MPRMTPAIDPARREDAPILAALFELYAYDLSDTLDLDVGDDGRYPVPPFDVYWTDPRCHAFLIRVEGRLAGFALVTERSRLTGDEHVRDMAEFFVMRRYRRRGVGEQVAVGLFRRFPGAWEVRQRFANVAATAFWRRIIGRHAEFSELTFDDERWRGPVQRFQARE
jgi:predicted acetyltransferase